MKSYISFTGFKIVSRVETEKSIDNHNSYNDSFIVSNPIGNSLHSFLLVRLILGVIYMDF